MIKGINTSGRHLTISGGQPMTTYLNSGYTSNPGVGNVRYHPSMNRLEVFDGNVWVELTSSYATVGLSRETEQLLDWAQQKRDAELQLIELAKSNPTIADALKTAKQAQEQLDIVVALTKVNE